MLNPLNQFSFPLIVAAVLAGLAVWFFRTGFNRRKALALGAVALAFGVAWFSLRTGASQFQNAAQAEFVIHTAQRPVLVEFYSDYCAACLSAKPGVDGLEQEYKDKLNVIRLDVASGAGIDLGVQLGVRVTPTFILFDADGRELRRMLGSLDIPAVRSALGAS